MVHCDIHTLSRTLGQVFKLLKPRGLMMLSVANLCSKLGYERFKSQKEFKVAGFYFMSPDIVHKIVEETGFQIVEEKREGMPSVEEHPVKNMYYARDICLLI